MMGPFPFPSQHSDWKSWAFALIKQLETPEEILIPQMQVLSVAKIGAINPKEGLGPVLAVDEIGGSVPVFADGSNWRRVTYRAIMA